MAMNNPYTAYQRFASVRMPNLKVITPDEDSKSEAPPKVNVANFGQFQSGKVADQYLENAVMTATPEELTLMLYDGAIKFMSQACTYMDMKNIEKTNHTLVRAQDIFSELMCTLKMEYEISSTLYNLYEFIRSNLMKANIKKDTELVRELISLTRDLRETWSQAIKIARKA